MLRQYFTNRIIIYTRAHMQMGRANSVAVLVTSRGFSDFPHPSATYRRLLSSPNPGVSCCLDSLERSGMMRGFRLRAQAKPAKLVLEAGSHILID